MVLCIFRRDFARVICSFSCVLCVVVYDFCVVSVSRVFVTCFAACLYDTHTMIVAVAVVAAVAAFCHRCCSYSLFRLSCTYA